MSDNAYLWFQLYISVDRKDWKNVERLANELAESLPNAVGVGGIYKIGFQRTFDAPPSTLKAIERYHAALEAARKKSTKKKKRKR